jgi:hypothetical protein
MVLIQVYGFFLCHMQAGNEGSREEGRAVAGAISGGED